LTEPRRTDAGSDPAPQPKLPLPLSRCFPAFSTPAPRGPSAPGQNLPAAPAAEQESFTPRGGNTNWEKQTWKGAFPPAVPAPRFPALLRGRQGGPSPQEKGFPYPSRHTPSSTFSPPQWLQLCGGRPRCLRRAAAGAPAGARRAQEGEINVMIREASPGCGSCISPCGC